MKPTKRRGQINSVGSRPKSTYRAGDAEKAPTWRHQKAPTGRNEKAPSYYIFSGVDGVVGVDALRSLLQEHNQHEWCSRISLGGLMLLIEFFANRRTPKDISCSVDLAHGYVSKIGRPKSANTIHEPLAVLCKVGVLRMVQPAVNGAHIKTSALYAFHEEYAKRRTDRFDVSLPPNLIKKREQAPERFEKRLNRRQAYRARLLADLQKLSFDAAARRLIAELLRDPNQKNSTQTVVEAIDLKKHSVRQNPRRQITTSISSCPKPLKAHLLLDGEAVVSCDVAHAHHCFLPRILSARIDYIRKQFGASAEVARYETERAKLIEFLSEGDYYRKWCVNGGDDAERSNKKLLLNVMLNWPNTKCESNALYQQMRRTFPLTFRIIEDIKRDDYRNISIQTQHYTAKAIGDALLELQAAGIPAIPDVDAIICQQRYRESVCEVIGRTVYEVSGGVRCKVSGVRYLPVTKDEKQILALNPVQAKAARMPGMRLRRSVEPKGESGQTVLFFGGQNNCNTLKPYRPLTEFEQDVLRRKGMESNPIVIEALNIFQGRIVG